MNQSYVSFGAPHNKCMSIDHEVPSNLFLVDIYQIVWYFTFQMWDCFQSFAAVPLVARPVDRSRERSYSHSFESRIC